MRRKLLPENEPPPKVTVTSPSPLSRTTTVSAAPLLLMLSVVPFGVTLTAGV
jgi:hypothetical protein